MTTVTVTRRRPFATLLGSEIRLFLRDLGGVFWSAALPVVALIVIGTIPATTRPTKTLHGMSYLDAYLPILMMFALCMATVNVLPPALATYRERGVLRRLSTTPVPPARMLAAQAVVHLALGIVVSLVLLVIGVAAFGVSLPDQLTGYAVSMLLVGAATTGLGLLVAGIAPSGKVANGLSMALFFPLMFLAGLWLPRTQMPSWLRRVSDASPLGAGVRAVQSSIAGHWPATSALLVLLGWALGTGAVAVRAFRWE